MKEESRDWEILSFLGYLQLNFFFEETKHLRTHTKFREQPLTYFCLSIHADLALFPYQLGKLPSPDKVPQLAGRQSSPGLQPPPQRPSHLQLPDLMRAVRDYQVMNSLASARLS